MPLTPQDVQNKEFSASSRMKKGYDEEEVDAFLDEVEAELNRLLTENADLRNRLNQLQTTVSAAPAPFAVPEPVTAVAQPVVAVVPEPVVAPVPAPAAEASEHAALRTLQLAQRTADSAVAEAKAEADKLVGDARVHAAELDREAQTRHATVMGQLETQRAALEARVEDLRAFEREYRTRLKAYLETQLRDLDGRTPADSASAPVPAPAAGSVPASVSASVPASLPAAVPAAVPSSGSGVPGLASPPGGSNPYAPTSGMGSNPYAPRPAQGNPFDDGPAGPPRQAGFETDDEGPEPIES